MISRVYIYRLYPYGYIMAITIGISWEYHGNIMGISWNVSHFMEIEEESKRRLPMAFFLEHGDLTRTRP